VTPEAQRIAIAEACGWRLLTIAEAAGFGFYTPGLYQNLGWVLLYSGQNKIAGSRRQDKDWQYWVGFLPDYSNDLNAMREAEWASGVETVKAMRFWLWQICDQMTAHSASAAQRAEAFLRATGKWTND
jgi:hypothetical protein